MEIDEETFIDNSVPLGDFRTLKFSFILSITIRRDERVTHPIFSEDTYFTEVRTRVEGELTACFIENT